MTALAVGPIAVNIAHRTVSAAGAYLLLTTAEFDVLALLLAAHGAAVPRDRLSRSVLGRPWHPGDRSTDQVVFGLRRKLPAAEDGTPLIQTVRGVGYWIRAAEGVGA